MVSLVDHLVTESLIHSLVSKRHGVVQLDAFFVLTERESVRSDIVTTQALLFHGSQEGLLSLSSLLEVTRHWTALQRRRRD